MISAESNESVSSAKYHIAEKNRIAKIKFLREQLLTAEEKEKDKTRRSSLEANASQRDYIPSAKDLSVPGTPVSSRYFTNLSTIKNRRLIIDSSESEGEDEISKLKQQHIELKNKEIQEYFISSETKQTYQRTFSEVVQVAGDVKIRNPEIIKYFEESEKVKTFTRPFSQVVVDPVVPKEEAASARKSSTQGDLSIPGTPVSSRHLMQNKKNSNYIDTSESEDDSAKTNSGSDVTTVTTASAAPSAPAKQIESEVKVNGDIPTSAEAIDPVKQFINDMNTLRKKDVDEYFEDSAARNTYKRTFSEAVNVVGQVKHKNPKVEEYFNVSEEKKTYRRPFGEVYQEWKPPAKSDDITVPGTPVDSKNFLSKWKILKKSSKKYKLKGNEKKGSAPETVVDDIPETYNDKSEPSTAEANKEPNWDFGQPPEKPPRAKQASSADVKSEEGEDREAIVVEEKIEDVYDYTKYQLGDILIPGTPISTAHLANCKVSSQPKIEEEDVVAEVVKEEASKEVTIIPIDASKESNAVIQDENEEEVKTNTSEVEEAAQLDKSEEVVPEAKMNETSAVDAVSLNQYSEDVATDIITEIKANGNLLNINEETLPSPAAEMEKEAARAAMKEEVPTTEGDKKIFHSSMLIDVSEVIELHVEIKESQQEVKPETPEAVEKEFEIITVIKAKPETVIEETASEIKIENESNEVKSNGVLPVTTTSATTTTTTTTSSTTSTTTTSTITSQSVQEFLQESLEKKTYKREFSEVVQFLGEPKFQSSKNPEINKYFESSNVTKSYSRTFSEAVQEVERKNSLTIEDLLKPGTPVNSKNLGSSSPKWKKKAVKTNTKLIDSRKSSVDSTVEDDIIDVTKEVLSPTARRRHLAKMGNTADATTSVTATENRKDDIIKGINLYFATSIYKNAYKRSISDNQGDEKGDEK